MLWKRKKINQEEYRHCLVHRLPLNTISKCERSHLKLIATPRLFRKIWQERLQHKGKQNNNKKGKHLRKRPYHFHTGGQHHLGCINTVASLQLQFYWYFRYQCKRGDVSLSWGLCFVLFCFFTDEESEERRGENSGSPSWSVVQLAIASTSPTSAFHTPPTQHSPQLGKKLHLLFYVKNFPWGERETTTHSDKGASPTNR